MSVFKRFARDIVSVVDFEFTVFYCTFVLSDLLYLEHYISLYHFVKVIKLY